MKVSSRIDYALSCLLDVAEQYDTKKPISVTNIAEREGLEVDYVEQLLIIMKRAGILKSVRGAKGGYMLASAPHRISAYDIVKAFEGEILELVCYRKKGRRSKCVHLHCCEVKKFWLGLGDAIEKYLENNTLEELLKLRKKEKK